MFLTEWEIFISYIGSQKFNTVTYEKDFDVIETGKIKELKLKEEELVILFESENEELQEMIFSKKNFVHCADARDFPNTEKYHGIRVQVKPIGWVVLG